MAAIIRDTFKTTALLNFVNSLNTDSLYLGIGRSQPWDLVSDLDTTVPLPENTLTDINADWEDMLSLKKVVSSDVYTGIFKEMWQANVKYDTWRHDWNGSITAVYNGPNQAPTTPTSLGDVKCFVITSNFSIYVCLKQGVVNGIVQPSIYSPEVGIGIGVNTGVVKTADGYYWRFLATTSPAELVKFSSKYYHPIATVSIAPAPTDPYYTQWLHQGYAAQHKGGIYVINVLSGGTGYNSGIAGTRDVTNAETDAEFKVIGDGLGLEYTVTYGAGGSISDIEITNPGSGYTHATISPNVGTGASFDVIYTPMSGLGTDPVKDTVARFLLINSILTGAEGSGDFTILNDYRKVSLVYNPTLFGTSTIATTSTLDATYSIGIDIGLAANAYPIDSIVTGATSGAKGRVVDYNSTTGILRIIRTSSENLGNLGANNSFQLFESITAIGGTGNSAISSIGDPEVQTHSGDIIYSEYRTPITRSELQVENLNIIIKY